MLVCIQCGLLTKKCEYDNHHHHYAIEGIMEIPLPEKENLPLKVNTKKVLQFSTVKIPLPEKECSTPEKLYPTVAKIFVPSSHLVKSEDELTRDDIIDILWDNHRFPSR